MSGIRTYTGEKINGMKTYGINTVAAAAKVGSDQMTRVLTTPVCRGVVSKFDLALDIADRYVDDYLPSGRQSFYLLMPFCIPYLRKVNLSLCVFFNSR